MSALDRALAAASLGRLTPAHIRDMALEASRRSTRGSEFEGGATARSMDEESPNRSRQHEHEWVAVTNYGMTWEAFDACWCGATRPIPCEHPVSWRTLDDTGKAYCAACTTLVPE